MSKPKPMLFSGSMVRDLLNTRPGVWPAEPIDPALPCKSQTRRLIKPQPPMPPYKAHYTVGDEVYISEAVRFHFIWQEDRRAALTYSVDGVVHDVSIPARVKTPKLGRWPGRILPVEWARPWRGAIKGVRAERLHDISHEDAIAEGAYDMLSSVPPIPEFREYWESLHGKKSWSANPWVFVYLVGRAR